MDLFELEVLDSGAENTEMLYACCTGGVNAARK